MKKTVCLSTMILSVMTCCESGAMTILDEQEMRVLVGETMPGPPYPKCKQNGACDPSPGGAECNCRVGVSSNCTCMSDTGCIEIPLLHTICDLNDKSSQTSCVATSGVFCCTKISDCRYADPLNPCVWIGAGTCSQGAGCTPTLQKQNNRNSCVNM